MHDQGLLRQAGRELVMLGIDQRARRLDGCFHNGFQLHRFPAQLKPAIADARYIQQIIEQQSHDAGLPGNGVMQANALRIGQGPVASQDMGCRAYRRQRVA